MNIILAEQEEIIKQSILLTDHRAVHIIKVLRAEVGDSVRLGVVNGLKGVGIIEDIQKNHPRSVLLNVHFNEPASPLPQIDIILALPRPIMTRRILSQATALGVGRFYLIHANRVEKSFWEASLFEQEGYKEHLKTGLEQAVDTRMPDVRLFKKFKPFVEDFLPTVTGDYSHCLVAHPTGCHSLVQGMAGVHGRILVAIGPEGGWVDYEVQKFIDAGFRSCTIGRRILKVDTAVVALHARISQIVEMRPL